MNIATFSPALTLLFAWALLWILMDVHYRDLTPAQKWLIPFLALLLAVANHFLRQHLGAEVYGKLILFTLHLPTFFVFRYITKCGTMKTIFMILSALVFTAPTIIINNITRRILFVGSTSALLLSNLIGYGITLLAAQFVFRKGFNYLLKYGDNRSFLSLSLVPFLFYIYTFSIINLDLSAFTSMSAYILRYIPTMEVFVFYFLLLNNYRELSRKKELETLQIALSQELDSAEEQISLLREAQTQAAIYQHDMRHHLTAIEAFLAANNPRQAEEYIQKVQADVAAITPRCFCENELVNLLCSSFLNKAEQLGVRPQIEAKLPKNLPISDTELCSLLSNGLENALSAAAVPEVTDKWVALYCGIRRNKLLIEIKNPYAGEILMQDGLPIASREGHGYGCHSIQSIAQRNRGLCTFEPDNGIFVLRVMLPMHNGAMPTVS